MWTRTVLLTTLLGLPGAALAATPPADPFLRSGPQAQPPSLGPVGVPAQPGAVQSGVPSGSGGSAASAPAAASVTGFGTPRFSSTGSSTRVVFDLPPGVSYTITPTFTGLRLDARGVTVRPLHLTRPGASVADYTLTPVPGGAQAILVTPFPLGTTDGWTAHETNISTGGQVLILTFGSTLTGGADATVSGSVQTVAAPSAAPVPAASINPQPGNPQLGTPPTAVPSSDLPPGDTSTPLTPATLPATTPALAGSTDVSRLTLGVIPGTTLAGVDGPVVGPPRVGKNPGLTRVVLDLPPGTGFRLTPLPLGLRVDLTGVSAPSSVLQSSPLSPELQGWSVSPTLTGISYTFVTGSAITLRSGWRDVLLPPAPGSTLSRLAIDLAPALADTSPLGRLALAPLVSQRRSVLAFSGDPARPRVVLDPGHGGIDPGAVGIVTEKVITLDVARRVRSDLSAAGIDVLMTRDGDTQLSRDKATDLSMRAAMGTNVAQLYVSIHVNSTEGASLLRGYGIETWWNRNNPNSQALAQVLQRDVVASTAAYSRGLQSGRSLAVLRENKLPAALVEVGFTSHPVDGQNLLDSNYLDRVAFGIASGIRDALASQLGANWR
ncbi:N-acetylmuramoyl-L-alanine amidase [Deinococcus sp. KNUC1210]|uniref:N-acetylmuramoyl-L-alanine amidase family protein n=1 Tax=Deinococcus sp. KNUC1210 TaxID=2917691 RepID=UPI001EF073C4|nr:N-acetylmuramoyl-L-alanine amidase [Deinococcus sp. KNUC1210]ULH15234.1 N-acetylmuramoyl-L-alanine amidase [Deinococcus sp. KNUC1210]